LLTVGDIMTRDVFVLSASASLEEATQALVVRDIGAAPVRDAGGWIVGVVSRSDLTDPERRAALRDARASGYAARAADLMTPGFLAARPSDAAVEAARLLVAEDAHRLLVFDDEGALVGIVTPTDVLRALAGSRRPSSPDDAGPTIH
jgi:CBS-domain-containing membrane protein